MMWTWISEVLKIVFLTQKILMQAMLQIFLKILKNTYYLFESGDRNRSCIWWFTPQMSPSAGVGPGQSWGPGAQSGPLTLEEEPGTAVIAILLGHLLAGSWSAEQS